MNALDYGPEVTRIIYCEMIPLEVGAGRSKARKDDISSGPEYEQFKREQRPELGWW